MLFNEKPSHAEQSGLYNVYNVILQAAMGKTFGQQVKEWRELRGLKQAEFARRIGRSRSYVHYLEHDLNPSAKGGKLKAGKETVDRISKALSIPLALVRVAAGYAAPEKDKEFDPFTERAIAILDEMPDEYKPVAVDILEALRRGQMVNANVPEELNKLKAKYGAKSKKDAHRSKKKSGLIS